MKLNKVLPYKLARVLPILGIAGASLFAGCSKEDEPPHDVEITFTSEDPWGVIQQNPDGTRQVSQLIKDYVAQPNVRTIYLVPEGGWGHISASGIPAIRKKTLEYAINYSPKVRGRGDFTIIHQRFVVVVILLSGLAERPCFPKTACGMFKMVGQ